MTNKLKALAILALTVAVAAGYAQSTASSPKPVHHKKAAAPKAVRFVRSGPGTASRIATKIVWRWPRCDCYGAKAWRMSARNRAA